jgi:hypothetical protein
MKVEAPGLNKSRSRFLLLISIALLVSLALLFGVLWGDLSGSHPSRLVGSQSTLEELIEDFLIALEEEDLDRLAELALSKEEFVELVYPGLPASDPKHNLSAEFLWRQTDMRSQADMRSTFSRYRGRELDLISFRFEKGAQEYPGFKVHKDTRILVEKEDGVQKELNLFGSILEMDGEFKIYSYVR